MGDRSFQKGRHDTLHNDTQHIGLNRDTHHNDIQNKGLNVEASYVNIMLDRSTYPNLKLVQFIILSEKLIVNKTQLVKPGKGAGIS